MVNKNRYEISTQTICKIKVTKPDDSFKTFVLMPDQLVSILYINLKGEPTVARGRISSFKYPEISRTEAVDTAISNLNRCINHSLNSEKLPVIEGIILDTSKNYNNSSAYISTTSILEVNPIDWEYQDTEKVVVDAPSDDWYEKDKKVSAPSSEYQYRLGGNNE